MLEPVPHKITQPTKWLARSRIGFYLTKHKHSNRQPFNTGFSQAHFVPPSPLVPRVTAGYVEPVVGASATKDNLAHVSGYPKTFFTVYASFMEVPFMRKIQSMTLTTAPGMDSGSAMVKLSILIPPIAAKGQKSQSSPSSRLGHIPFRVHSGECRFMNSSTHNF